MADDSSSLDFRIRISTPADTSGADEAQAKIENLAKTTSGVGDAAGEGEKGLRRMIQEAGTIREAQRISQGFFDVFLGGGRTIQGTAEIMRFFIATAADINPIFASLAVVGASIAVVAGRQAEHNEKMKEGGGEADGFATAIEKSQERVRTAYEKTEKQNANLMEALEHQATAAERQATALGKSLDLQKQLNDEILRGLEITALANNKDGPAGEIAIRQRFEGLKRERDLKSDIAKIDLEQDANLVAQGNVGKQAHEKRRETDNEQARLTQLQGNRDRTASVAGAYGYGVNQSASPEDQTKAWEAIQKGASEAVKEAADAYAAMSAWNDAAQQGMKDHPGDPVIQTSAEQTQEKTDKAHQALTEAATRDRAVADAAHAQGAYADKDTGAAALQEKIDKNTQELTDLGTNVSDLKDAFKNLDLQKQGLILKGQDDQGTAKQKDAQELLAQQNKEFAAKNDERIKELERTASDPDQLPSTRYGAIAGAAALRNQGLQRQLDEGAQPGPNNLSADQAQLLRQQMADNKADADRKIRDLRDQSLGISADKKPEYDVATTALQALVQQGLGLVNGGNNATAQGALAAMLGDTRSQGAYLAQMFGQHDPSSEEGILGQRIGSALTEQSAATPPASGKGAKDNPLVDMDQLNSGLSQATDAAAAAHLQLPGTINQAVGFMDRTLKVAEALEASTNPKLIAIGQRLEALERKTRSTGNMGNN